jgi:hypothetical protein
MSPVLNPAFVGTRSVSSSEELRQLLVSLPASSRCYFLRWVHKVSGFQHQLPVEFPSPEGEMMTPDFEVRWKGQRDGYDVLLLAHTVEAAAWGFEAVAKSWGTSEALPTYWHNSGDTPDMRFPKTFLYPKNLKLQQRYFHDRETGTVHFVALTLEEKAS